VAHLLIRLHGPQSALALAFGSGFKGRISPVLYAIGIAAAFVHPWIACGFYVAVAVMWFIPDRRIERRLAGDHPDPE
jgi:hypothetical protein